MNNKIQYTLGMALLFAGLQNTWAQKKDENLGTEVVNVVKPYTPTISDAFKVKETPVMEDEETAKKEEIKYNIFSFPVASTFVPSKGKAAGVDKEAQEQLYKNYASFGVGNYASLNGELYVTHDVSDKAYVAGKFLHQSALANIKNVPLDSDFLDTSLDLTYGSKEENFSWNTDLGYQNQKYNWYGLPINFGSTLTRLEEKQALINSIDPKHMYNNFYVGGKIKFNEGVFDQADLKYNYFSDGFGSGENRFYLRPDFKFNMGDNALRTNILLDYVGGSFEKRYYDGMPALLDYGYFNMGLSPNYVINKEDLSVNVGVNLFYSIDNENKKNKFYFYPKLTAAYKLVEDFMTVYGGLEGELKQNSYRDFTNINPYLSPTLDIKPTDAQFDLNVGLKGKLATYLGYNLRGSMLSERNKALFKSNDFSEQAGREDYEYGNSMKVVFDNVKTFSFFGELKADISEKVAFAINGTFSNYTHDRQPETWNLPAVKLESHLDVDFAKKWYANMHLFYVGSRKDNQVNTDLPASPLVVTNLPGYFDANAQLGYRHNERLSGFLKLNNFANQNYRAWMNFPVQRFQVLLGANYKFDF